MSKANVGDRFGRLIVIGIAERVKGTRNYKVPVECDCGTIKRVWVQNLYHPARPLRVKSCSCLRKEAADLVLEMEQSNRNPDAA